MHGYRKSSIEEVLGQIPVQMDTVGPISIEEHRSALATSRNGSPAADWTRRTSRWNHQEHDEAALKYHHVIVKDQMK